LRKNFSGQRLALLAIQRGAGGIGFDLQLQSGRHGDGAIEH
jgi:hypothetical protein